MIRTVFFHIPKAAGTSIKEYLIRIHSRPRTLRVWGLSSGGDLESGDLANYAPPDLGALHAVMGHFNVQQFRANPMLLDDFNRHGQFALSALRDPFERVLSDYWYILNTQHHPRRESVARMTSLEYAMRVAPNLQCQWLGVTEVTPAGPVYSRQDKISSHMILLLDEAVDTVMPKIAFNCGGAGGATVRKNLGQRARENIPPEALELFRKRNRLDYSLIEFLRESSGKHATAAMEFLS